MPPDGQVARFLRERPRLALELTRRAAELAVINSVQAALPAKLDMQAIHEVVGEKFREAFAKAQAVLILTLDHESELYRFEYNCEKGQRLEPAPMPFDGFARHLIASGRTYLDNHITEENLA